MTADRMPLFALGTVLFPGLVLPLHVFEERYRALIADHTATGRFGVIAIKKGWEVGDTSAVELYEVGCTAEIRQVTTHADGRFDLVTVGRRRFRVVTLHNDLAPYPIADVEWIDGTTDAPEPDADKLVPGLLEQFQRYLKLLRTDGNPPFEQMPDDPIVLSHLIAATAVLTLDERQRLLSLPTARERLLAERRILAREITLLGQVRAVPTPIADFASPHSDN